MTEEEARRWAAERFDVTIIERLGAFAALVTAENERQNLISPTTISGIWSRHIVDSLQLLDHAARDGLWLDIGTGGGFPGMVIALARPTATVLVEPRRRRAAFLMEAAAMLGATNVQVRAQRVEQVMDVARIISARAVASIENLLRVAAHCATQQTRWLLPRGKLDRAELEKVAETHRLMFHVEQSVTQSESSILVLETR